MRLTPLNFAALIVALNVLLCVACITVDAYTRRAR